MIDKRFEKLLKQKLDGLETPPPDDVWTRIEAALPEMKPRETDTELPDTTSEKRHPRLRPWVWTSASAVAAIAALVLLFHHPRTDAPVAMAFDHEDTSAVSELALMDKEETSAEEDAKDNLDGRNLGTSEGGETMKAERTPATLMAKANAQTSKGETMALPMAEKIADIYAENSPEGSAHAVQATAENVAGSGHDEPSVPATGADKSASSRAENLLSALAESEKKEEKAVGDADNVPLYAKASSVNRSTGSALSHNAGRRFSASSLRHERSDFRRNVRGNVYFAGNTIAQQTNQQPAILLMDQNIQHPDMENREGISLTSSGDGNIREKHLPPFLVGVDVSFPVSPRLYLETGLSYSILASTFTMELPQNVLHQQAHFLGVPLRVRVAVFQHQPWNVYLSAGGKWEKCLTVHSDDTENHLLTDDRPSQWSLQMSAGAEYQLSRYAAFYLEPGVGYYFDNHSTLRTAYDVRPTNFSLKMGLRFTIGGK